MRKSNQNEKIVNNIADTTSTNLFQPISDEQAETIRGGYGWERYCHQALKIKNIDRLW